LVPRAAIARVIRQTAAAFSTKPRIAPDAIDALRTASEDIIIEHMKRAYKYTMIARKQTLSPEHMQAAADDMIREVNRAATR
jgi:histone H3/H4